MWFVREEQGRCLINVSLLSSACFQKWLCSVWRSQMWAKWLAIIEVTNQFTTEKAMAPYSSTLAWKIPWTEEPGRLQSMVLLRVGHDWATSLSLFTSMHWRRKWQPTPVFLPAEPGGLPSMGSHRVRHDWSNLAAAAAAPHTCVRIGSPPQ